MNIMEIGEINVVCFLFEFVSENVIENLENRY